MFNKTYQLRAIRQAGGGHRVATKALLRLPEPWRPLITIAAAGEEAFYRSKKRVRPGKSRQKSASSAQLELFPVKNPDVIKFPAAKSDRPLFDIFPEAYE
jgi:hypothetical protein